MFKIFFAGHCIVLNRSKCSYKHGVLIKKRKKDTITVRDRKNDDDQAIKVFRNVLHIYNIIFFNKKVRTFNCSYNFNLLVLITSEKLFLF